MKYTIEKLELLGLSFQQDNGVVVLTDFQHGIVGNYKEYLKYPKHFPKSDSEKIGTIKINHPCYRCSNKENENEQSLNLTLTIRGKDSNNICHIFKDYNSFKIEMKKNQPRIKAEISLLNGNSLFYHYENPVDHLIYDGIFDFSNMDCFRISSECTIQDEMYETNIEQKDGMIQSRFVSNGETVSILKHDSLFSALESNENLFYYLGKVVDEINVNWINDDKIIGKLIDGIELQDDFENAFIEILLKENKKQKKVY